MRIALLSFLFASFLFAACGGTDPEPTVLPKISVSDVTFFEGDDGAGNGFSFQLTLDRSPEEQVSVRVRTSNGTAESGQDFQALDEVMSFSVGQSSITALVNIVGDSIREGDEQFTVEILEPVNAVIQTAVGTGTIRNDDTYLAIDDVGYSTPMSYPGMTLTWSDEFDGSTLNAANWTYEIGDGCPSLCGWG